MRLTILAILLLSCIPKKKDETEQPVLPTYDHELEDLELDGLPEAGDGDTGASL